jgi:hypothetical protein
MRSANTLHTFAARGSQFCALALLQAVSTLRTIMAAVLVASL